MKKSISILLILVMFIAMISGCSKDKGIKNEKTPDASVEAAVAKLFDDFKDNSLGKFEDYFAEDSDEKDDFEEMSYMNALAESFLEVVGPATDTLDSEKTEELKEKVINKTFGSIDYEIKSVAVNGDEAEVALAVEMPTFDDSSLDTEELMAEAFGIDINDPVSLLEKWAEKEGKTVPELTEEFADSDQSEIMMEMLELFSDEFDDFLSLALDEMVKETEKKDIIATVKQQADGEWKIVKMD